MNASDDRIRHSALIPWVFALVALFGCNAMIPHAVSARKGKDKDGSCVTQIAGDASSKETVSNPQVLLAPGPSEAIQSKGLPATLLGIDRGRDQTAPNTWRGGVRGRAPPMEAGC